MLYPSTPEGPQGGIISTDKKGVNVGLDAFRIVQPFAGYQHGGFITPDKAGYKVPVAAYKIDEEQVGIMMLDSNGKRIPVKLIQEQDFNYLKCGDGGVSQSGGTGEFFQTQRLGNIPGTVSIVYDMYSVPDQLEVYYNNVVIASTGGLVSDDGVIYFNWVPVGGNLDVIIRLYAPNSSTSWWYNLNCPTGVPCTNKQPNTGSKTFTIRVGGNCFGGQPCDYSAVVCGCNSTRADGKIYREKVTVTSVTIPASYMSLQSYTMMEYKSNITYCSSPPLSGFQYCPSQTSVLHKALAPVTVNSVLWDYCSEAPGCEIPYHNIFFRYCKTDSGYVYESAIDTAEITLLCEITEVVNCEGIIILE